MNHSTRFEGGYSLVIRATIVALAAGLAGAVPIVFWITWELVVHGVSPANARFLTWLLIGAVAAAAVLSRLGGQAISISPDAQREARARRRFHLPVRAHGSHA